MEACKHYDPDVAIYAYVDDQAVEVDVPFDKEEVKATNVYSKADRKVAI